MAKRIREHLAPHEIEGAETIIGKTLIHVCKLEPKSGCGFALCFGDKRDATEGHMIVIRMEPKEELETHRRETDTKYSLKFYYDGCWKGKEITLN